MVSTLRRALYVVVLLLFAAAAAVFAYSNPDQISVDIGLIRFENVSMSLAFACAFVSGWIFGLVTVGVGLLRMAGERRKLKRDLRFAEDELSTLRSLPMQDAN